MRKVVIIYTSTMRLRHVAAKAALLLLIPVACSTGQAGCHPDQAVSLAREKAKDLSWNIEGWRVKVDDHPTAWAVHFRHPEGGAGGGYSFEISKTSCTVVDQIGFQ
jgi:hypothetical protein